MNEITSTPSNINSEEIDLVKLFIKAILFLRKYSIIFIIAIVIGLVVGYGLTLLPKKSHYSAFLVANSSLTNEDVFEVVKSINEKKLKIPATDYNRIAAIKIENVMTPTAWDIDGNPTTIAKSKFFKVNIDFSRLSDKDNVQEQQPFLDTVRNSIVNYFNDNPYVKERESYEKMAINNMIGEISDQLKKLDTLQKRMMEEKPLRGQGLIENAGKQSFSSDILTLLEKKLKLEESFQFDKPIKIYEDFNCTIVVEPGISNSKIGLIIFAFFALAFLYAFSKEMKELKMKSAKNEMSQKY